MAPLNPRHVSPESNNEEVRRRYCAHNLLPGFLGSQSVINTHICTLALREPHPEVVHGVARSDGHLARRVRLVPLEVRIQVQLLTMGGIKSRRKDWERFKEPQYQTDGPRLSEIE